ncbi:hypothetical protein U9M48_030832 [Paspalum notatum var. saurae]|uniref:Uncharacterized protein n=1 Tax=Paspalum notatum var. saurae TaxID=547442 RepID=A0AAQ3X321_PASNO
MTHDLKPNLRDHDETKWTNGSHTDDPTDDATDQKTKWMRQPKRSHQNWQTQRKEDEASPAPKGAKSHDDEGQYQPGDPCDDPEHSKSQNQG